MAKIFIFIFNFIIITSLFSDSKIESRELKEKIKLLQEEGKFSESLPLLEKYFRLFPFDAGFKIYLGKAYLFREDLPVISRDDDSFQTETKVNVIHSNYERSSKIFREYIKSMETSLPDDPGLGKSYFYLGLSEMFSGKKEKAISTFLKSSSYSETKAEALYNASICNEMLGKRRDSEAILGKLGKLNK